MALHCPRPNWHGRLAKLSPSGPDSYRFVEHRDYLGNYDKMTLVLHDWGSALGIDWANRHRSAVKGIVYMEAIVKTINWDEWPRSMKPIFAGFHSPA